MSRFGSTATFFADSGSGVFVQVLGLSQSAMPEYPFETTIITDKRNIRTLGGFEYTYKNYQKYMYKFKWNSLDETTTNIMRTMFMNYSRFNFKSNGTNFGTFIFAEDSFSDNEVAFERYDVSFSLIEEAP